MKLIQRLLAASLLMGFISTCLIQQVVAEPSEKVIASLKSNAARGDAEAQFLLGLEYTAGNGVSQDDKQGVYWFTKAAEQGHADAQYILGLSYYEGVGVLQDYKQAVHWYTKAAEQGDAYAQSNLGAMYATGRGLLQDYAKAYAWWNLAASQGNEEAKVNRDIILKKMSPSQIEEGQKLSRELYEKINNQAK